MAAKPWGGSNSIGRAVPEGWYTTAEAAKMVGRSQDTVKRWRQGDTPLFMPSRQVQMGRLTVYLYSADDITQMRLLAKTLRPGRKPTEN